MKMEHKMEHARHSGGADRQTVITLAVVTAWFAAALALIATGTLSPAAGEPPLRILIAATAPVLVFLGCHAGSRSFREWVLALDLRLLVMFQGWRVLGGMFLVLMTFDLLPSLFAWPAGLGDVAIGLTAPFVALALLRRPDAALDRKFLVWNLLGIFDFVVAIGAGVATSGAFPAFSQNVTSAAMNSWPLAMIPGFLVPMFAMMHLAAIFQVLRLRRGVAQSAGADRVPA
jgi:hypothetical protein